MVVEKGLVWSWQQKSLFFLMVDYLVLPRNLLFLLNRLYHVEFLKNMMKIDMSGVLGRFFFEMENLYWLSHLMKYSNHWKAQCFSQNMKNSVVVFFCFSSMSKHNKTPFRFW